MAGPAASAKEPDPLDGDWGELDLALGGPAAPVVASKPAAAKPPPAASLAADDDDPLDPMLGDLPELELDYPVAPPRATPKAAPSIDPAPAAASRAGGPSAAGVASPAASRAGDVDRLEALALAGYGPAPSGLWPSVMYAIHVFSRRRELAVSLDEAKRNHAAARAACDGALVAVGRELRARAAELGLDELRAQLDAVDRALGESSTREQARAQAEAIASARRSDLDQRIEAAKREIGPFRDRETKLVTALGVKEQDLKRAQARLHRAEIELRNLTSAAPGTSIDEARKAMLEGDIVARRAEVAALEPPVKELQAQLGPVRRELAQRTTLLATLEDEKRKAEESLRRDEEALAAAGQSATRELENAYRELGEAALHRDLARPTGDLAVRATSASAAAGVAARKERLHEAALDAWDRPAFKRGATIIGGAAFLIFAMLVVMIVR